jgi:uncharacterized protein DUF397
MERRIIVTGWRKSSFSSGNGGNCLEAGNAGPAVAVRDTKQNGEGPVLAFGPATWAAFTANLKNS